MKRTSVLGRRIAATLVVIGAIAAYMSVAASANGRELEGAFCTTNTGSRICMSLTWDGVEYGTTNRASLSLRPGTYWLTVNDPTTFHNFSLRSCPDLDAACVKDAGDEQEITTIPGAPGEVTVKLQFEHGTYRLFCATGNHEDQGMFVDFAVGGVGQVE